MVTRTRLNIALYVHCLPCYNSESAYLSEIHTKYDMKENVVFQF